LGITTSSSTATRTGGLAVGLSTKSLPRCTHDVLQSSCSSAGKLPRERPNQAMQRTAGRTAFQLSMYFHVQPAATLAIASGR
jgi:hypothetical protein